MAIDLSGVYSLIGNSQKNRETVINLGAQGTEGGTYVPESWRTQAQKDFQTKQSYYAPSTGENLMSMASGIGAGLKETASGFGRGVIMTADIIDKLTSPGRAFIDTATGFRTDSNGNSVPAGGDSSFASLYQENLINDMAKKTMYEKVYGVNLADPNKGFIENLTSTDTRKAIASAVALPTFFYGGSAGLNTLTKGGSAGLRIAGTAGIGAQTGLAMSIPSTFASDNWNSPNAYLSNAIKDLFTGAVMGVATAGLGEGVRYIVSNSKINNFLKSNNIGKDISKNLTRDQKLALYNLGNTKISKKKLLSAANIMASETSGKIANRKAGLADTGNTATDFLINKIREVKGQLPKIAEQRSKVISERVTLGQKKAASATTNLEKLRIERSAMGGSYNLEKSMVPLDIPTDVKEGIASQIVNSNLKTLEKGNALDALDAMIRGEIPTEYNLTQLSKAIKHDLGKEFASTKLPGKMWQAVQAVGDFKRSLMASGDISGVLRQAFPVVSKLALSHPLELKKMFVDSLDYIIDPAKFKLDMDNLKLEPNYQQLVDRGIKISTVGNKMYDVGNESFAGAGNLAEKFKGTSWIVNPSERQYVGFLNKVRIYEANRQLKLIDGTGVTGEARDKLIDAMVKLVNDSTGAGTLKGSYLQQHANTLNSVLFAPGLMMSRISFFNPANYNPTSVIGRQRTYELASMITTGMGFLWLAEQAGAKVEKDPRSTSFGKAQIGNTKVDMLGGFQPYIRFAAQQITGETKDSSGKIHTLGAEFGGPTRLSLAGSFVRGKLNPLTADVVDLTTGTNMIGEPMNLPKIALRGLSPLAWNDILDAIKGNPESGTLFNLGIASAAMLGAGIQTTTPEEKIASSEEKRAYTQLLESGDLKKQALYKITGIK